MKKSMISVHSKEMELETYPKLIASVQMDKPWHVFYIPSN